MQSVSEASPNIDFSDPAGVLLRTITAITDHCKPGGSRKSSSEHISGFDPGTRCAFASLHGLLRETPAASTAFHRTGAVLI